MQLLYELNHARELFNMTQDQFAKEAGMVRQTLSSFERGEKCSKKTKYKIAFTICSLLNANYSKMKADDILFLK